MIITIDGPAASGKSSVARLLANELNYLYLSTGFFYRALAWILAKRFGYTSKTIMHPASIDISHALDPHAFAYILDKGQPPRIEYKGVDITAKLKSPDVDEWSSIMSQNTQVRIMLVSMVRKSVENRNAVVEGRDCGSVIFPNAAHKFYLTAPVEVRAERWQQDQAKRGIVVSLEQACERILERDERDATRKVDPLVIPEGAQVVDSSQLTLDETVQLFKKAVSS